MKFKFPFDHVLEFRKQNENLARLDYTESVDKLEKEKAHLKKLYAEWDGASDEIFSLQSEKSTPLARIIYLNDFLDGQKLRIDHQKLVVRNLTQIAEQKHEILIAAVKEFEIIAKLKKNKQAIFKKQESKREAKVMDEVVVTRYRRGGL